MDESDRMLINNFLASHGDNALFKGIEGLRISDLITVLEEAGELIMSFYHSGNIQVDIKVDDSPVTSADKASNDFILGKLQALYPDTPIISEETTHIPFEIRKNWEYCWMLDPLDGTKEFLKRNGEFSINLALIKDHLPVIGFVHFPVQKWTYFAIKGKGAYKLDSESVLSELPLDTSHLQLPVRIMISRSHSGQRELDFILKIQGLGYEVHTLPHGSAMKHCLIAEGLGDVYPKFGTCSEWDTAPGQLILEEAGGKITRTDNGKALTYNKQDFENPEFIMWGPNSPKDLLNNFPNS